MRSRYVTTPAARPQRAVPFEVANSGAEPLAITSVSFWLASNAQLGDLSLSNVMAFM